MAPFTRSGLFIGQLIQIDNHSITVAARQKQTFIWKEHKVQKFLFYTRNGIPLNLSFNIYRNKWRDPLSFLCCIRIVLAICPSWVMLWWCVNAQGGLMMMTMMRQWCIKDCCNHGIPGSPLSIWGQLRPFLFIRSNLRSGAPLPGHDETRDQAGHWQSGERILQKYFLHG